MPVIDSNGCAIDAEITGPAEAPVLMLSNSLGTTRAHVGSADDGLHAEVSRAALRPARTWQVRRAERPLHRWRCSDAMRIAVLDGLGIKKANWLGLSMGGMEGMWLGANAGDRFDKIILSNALDAIMPTRPSGTIAWMR